MIKLVDGLGQLGSALTDRISSAINYQREIYDAMEATIYHTWNFLDKTENRQAECLEKFRKYLLANEDESIFFISTKCNDDTPYVIAKRKAEELLLNDRDNACVIRLPNIIGKGICQRFRDEDVKPFGELELLSADEAAKQVLYEADLSFNQHKGESVVEVAGEKISANLVYDLIVFGAERE